MQHKKTTQSCEFTTERLSVRSWKNDIPEECIITILTPNVTKALPEGWQNITTLPAARKWFDDRKNESTILIISSLSLNEIVGFIFLYESDPDSKYVDLRFGYLLSETVWGRGYGTEVIKGLIDWCKAAGNIKSISGGVEAGNIGSIKVLEKAGFSPSPANKPQEPTIIYDYQFH